MIIENGGYDDSFSAISTTFSGSIRSASNGVISPDGSGNGNFEINCGGSITLTGTASDYGGLTKINSGTIIVSGECFSQSNWAVGDAAGTADGARGRYRRQHATPLCWWIAGPEVRAERAVAIRQYRQHPQWAERTPAGP